MKNTAIVKIRFLSALLAVVMILFVMPTVEISFSAAQVNDDSNGATSDIVYGDVSGDDDVTIGDATIIMRYLAKIIDLDETQKKLADVDFDGNVTINDVSIIQRFLAKLIDIEIPTRIYYFLRYDRWSESELGQGVYVYWTEGSNKPMSWPGHEAERAEYNEPVYYIEVPIDVPEIIFANGLDWGDEYAIRTPRIKLSEENANKICCMVANEKEESGIITSIYGVWFELKDKEKWKGYQTVFWDLQGRYSYSSWRQSQWDSLDY